MSAATFNKASHKTSPRGTEWKQGLLYGVALLLLFRSASSGAQALHLEAAAAHLEGPTLKIVPAPPGRELPHTNSTRKSYVTGFEQPTDRLLFRFKIKTPGQYQLRIAYRTAAQKGYEIKVKDQGLSGLFPPSSTGKSGPTFATFPAGRVELTAGENTVTFNRGWGFYDIASIDLTPASPPHPPLPVTTPPADPAATPEARALLARLDAAYGKSTALGVYTDADAAYVEQTTGLRPAIMGGDLMRWSPAYIAHEPHHEDDVARLLAAAKAGYTLTLLWHWASPFGGLETPKIPWWRFFYTDGTTFNAARAVDPSTPEHAAALADIDAVALQLRRLQDAGVPILFRPLHEAQGGWFWWGAKGPAVYKQLWNMLYDRLTVTDGIHNLLWVFTSAEDPAWYPGDSRVDIVAIDAYPTDLHDPESGLWDTLLRQHNGRKPLAVAEFGGVPDIPRMRRFGEPWLYAVSWSADLGPRKNPPAELKAIYRSPDVLTLPPSPAIDAPRDIH